MYIYLTTKVIFQRCVQNVTTTFVTAAASDFSKSWNSYDQVTYGESDLRFATSTTICAKQPETCRYSSVLYCVIDRSFVLGMDTHNLPHASCLYV